jgi:hypothetical protein
MLKSKGRALKQCNIIQSGNRHKSSSKKYRSSSKKSSNRHSTLNANCRSCLRAHLKREANVRRNTSARLRSEVPVVEGQCLNPHSMGGTEFDKICEVIR